MKEYLWKLSDTNFTKDKGTVFSCFSCGGGSTMGYKLAGFDVIGHNDIDEKMVDVYKLNHKPKFSYLESITTLAKRKDFPDELYNLDILDGSPPCSTFSMAGKREKDWGKKKKFKEGQAEQVLDTLFFDFIDLANELKPKVVVAENVKALMYGNAIDYVRRIYSAFDYAGYTCEHFLLDSSTMGVPQRRERVFFIAFRKDLAEPFLEQVDMFTMKPKIKLEFNEKPILFKEIYQPNVCDTKHKKDSNLYKMWQKRIDSDTTLGDTYKREENRLSCFTVCFFKPNEVAPTFTRQDRTLLFDEFRSVNRSEACSIGSYPQDYNFNKTNYGYLIGMSVPPLMTKKISLEIYNQWLTKLN